MDPRNVGVHQARSPVDDEDLVVGTDGVVWHLPRSHVRREWHPMVPPNVTQVCTPDGHLVGYTMLQISRHAPSIHLVKMPEFSLASITMAPPTTGASTAMEVVRLDIVRGRPDVLIAQDREQLRGLREVTLFRDPPAVRTDATMYGEEVWYQLREQRYVVEMRERGEVDVTGELMRVYQIQRSMAPPGWRIVGTSSWISYVSVRQGPPIQLGALWADSLPDRTPLERVTVVGEIEAWRGWRVSGGRLTSVYKTEHVWQPNEDFVSKPPEDFDDNDGVHAFKVRVHAAAYLTSAFAGHVTVLGRAALWGDVIEGTLGYRAERARVLSLDAVLNNPRRNTIAGIYVKSLDGRDAWPDPVRANREDAELLAFLRKVYGLNGGGRDDAR